ncbi:hypothetical protein BDW66DRAFT_163304 [Aspergillus desertorum]
MQFKVTGLLATAVLGLQGPSRSPTPPGSSNAAIILEAQKRSTCANAHLSGCKRTITAACLVMASVEDFVSTGGGQGLVGGQRNNYSSCCDAGENELVAFLGRCVAVLSSSLTVTQNGLANVARPCIPVQVL